MRPLRIALALSAIVAAAHLEPARADPATRIAVVDTSRLWDAGGIARWLAARAELDAEEKQLVVVESPDGKTPEPACPRSTAGMKDLCKRLEEAKARGQAAMVMRQREREVLDPIEADVMAALERFARARGIDIILDRHEIGAALLVVAARVDLTDAFMKHYNASAARPKRTP